MPRLDNTDPQLHNIIVARAIEPYLVPTLHQLENDPGDIPPLDVCWDCYDGYGLFDFDEIDHPNYEDSKYYCRGCRRKLSNLDN